MRSSDTNIVLQTYNHSIRVSVFVRRGKMPRRLSASLLKSALVEKVESEQAVFFAQRDGRPLSGEGPLHLDDLRIALRHVGDVGEGDGWRHLLFEREARLRVIIDAGKRGVDAQLAHAEEALQAA